MIESRRNFIKSTLGLSVGLLTSSRLLGNANPSYRSPFIIKNQAPRIRFSVIGMNHGHIYGQVNTMIRGGGELVSFHAREADLAAAFAKRFPQAKQAQSEAEILNDDSIQMVVSSIIPNERSPLGIRVMEHGKDFMVDKPGLTSLSQLKAVRKVQQRTKRIYSIAYGRFESRSIVKAGELVHAGVIGKVVQTIGLGPYQMNPQT